jgi:hypothetical protein
MNAELLLYLTGEEVHAGDRVQYDGTYSTVVYVNHGESEELVPGYDDRRGSERGIILSDDDGNLTTIGDPDSRLDFIERG